MEARADRPGRDGEHLRRLVQAEAQVVMQDEDGTLVEIEASEAALELVAPGQIRGKIERVARRFRHHGWIDLHLDGPAALVPVGLAIAGPDKEPMEPGV